MTGAVTYEQVQWFIAEIVIVASILITIWKVVAGKIADVEKTTEAGLATLEKEIKTASDDLSHFKLEVAQKYASQQHLKDTEERLVAAINKLESAIAAMPASIAALINTGRSATRSKS